MKLGMLCNCSKGGDPKEQLSPSLVNRAVMIDELLAPAGIRMFLFSPENVDGSNSVQGYRVDGHDFVPDHQPIPKVNANWTYGTRRLINEGGMGYKRFKRWVRENRIEIFVPYEFSELVSNKQKTYDALREYDESLHPHTEDLSGSAAQVRSFLERNDLAFVKPRAGNKGNKIFVMRQAPEGISLKYYEDGSQRLLSPLTIDAALGVIDIAASQKRYVIQQGIESLRYEGAVFDVRVVMVNDGESWHSILETRLAPRDSDLSNVFQGGSIQVTEDLFAELFGEDEGLALGQAVRDASHGVARHFEARFPGQLMELGFDFVLDESRGIHLVEVNAKPGVAGFGSENKIFDWKAEDDAYYEKWVRPQVKHLAAFFRDKVERAAAAA